MAEDEEEEVPGTWRTRKFIEAIPEALFWYTMFLKVELLTVMRVVKVVQTTVVKDCEIVRSCAVMLLIFMLSHPADVMLYTDFALIEAKKSALTVRLFT